MSDHTTRRDTGMNHTCPSPWRHRLAAATVLIGAVNAALFTASGWDLLAGAWTVYAALMAVETTRRWRTYRQATTACPACQPCEPDPTTA